MAKSRFCQDDSILKMVKNISYSFFTQILPLVFAILLIPALIRGLGDTKFGLLTLSWVFLGYFSLFNFGVGRATTKYVAEYRGSGRDSEIPTLIKTSWLLLIQLGLLGSLCLYFARSFVIERFLEIPLTLYDEAYSVFLIIALSVPIVIYTTGIQAVLEAYERFRLIAIISTPVGMMNYLIPFIILGITNRLDFIVLALLINRILFLLIFFVVCKKVVPNLKSGSMFNKTVMNKLIRFGGWLTISNIISPLMSYMDRFIVGSMVSVSAVTYYVTSYEIANRLRVFPRSLMPVLFPAFSNLALHAPLKAASLFHRAVKYLWLLTIPIMSWITACSYQILAVWVGNEFAERGAVVLSILAIGWLINYGAQIASNFVQSSGYANVTALFHIIELPVFLLLAWILVPAWGIVGVALAWFGRVLLDAVCLFGAALYLLPAEQRDVSYIFPLAFLSMLMIVSTALLVNLSKNYWIGLLTAMLSLLTYLPIVWFLFLDDNEKDYGKMMVSKAYKR